uniref:PQQ-binding-like beta-propeller repeat protein n=1 Tax=Natrinema halophilum TaxID=1699371 RepID=A0A7D5GSZ2_9EURY
MNSTNSDEYREPVSDRTSARRRVLQSIAGIGIASTVGAASVTGANATEIGAGDEIWRWDYPMEYVPNLMAADGTIYVGSVDDVTVYARDAATGDEKWTFSDSGRRVSTMELINGVLLVDNSPDLVALDAETGEEEWRLDRDYVATLLAVIDDTVLCEFDSTLYAVDVATGEEQWHFDADEISSTSDPRAADDIVFVSSKGVLYALDIATGEEAWRFEADDDVEWIRTPVVENTTAYTWSKGTLYAFDVETGTVEWQTDWQFDVIDSEVNPRMVVDGTLVIENYLGVEAPPTRHEEREIATYHRLSAVDAATGEMQWHYELEAEGDYHPEGTKFELHTETDGMLFLEHYAGTAKVSVVDVATGDETWTTEYDSEVDSAMVLGDLFIVNDGFEADISAVEAATGQKGWHFGDGSKDYTVTGSDGTVFVAGEDNVYALDAGPAGSGGGSEDESGTPSSDDSGNESAANSSEESGTGSDGGGDEIPGMGIPAAVSGLGGVGYLLRRRLERSEPDDETK